MNAPMMSGGFDVARTSVAGFRLENEGYCVIRNLAPPSMIARINADLDEDFRETPFCRGPFYGERTKRFGRLLTRSSSVQALVLHPIILSLAERVLGLWCDTIQLNVAQAIEIHPDALAQFPHRDQDMWRGATGTSEYLINVMWPLTPFTRDNGATMIWPDSHGAGAVLEQPESEPVVAECDPGDAIVFLGSTLHAAGANVTQHSRRAIVIGYSLGWLRAYENQSLAYPPHIARDFPPELAGLVGYRQHRPNLGNFEGQCPSLLLAGRGDERLAAIDALRPDQTALLAYYVEKQRGGGLSGRDTRAAAGQ